MFELPAEANIVIDVPIQTVYAYICDFQKHGEWNNQPSTIIKITDGPVGIGSVFRTEEQLPRQANDLQMFWERFAPILAAAEGEAGTAAVVTRAEITDMQLNRRLAWTAWLSTKDAPPLRADWEIILEEEGTSTKLIQRYIWKPQNKAMEELFMDYSEDFLNMSIYETSNNLVGLKALLEGTAA